MNTITDFIKKYPNDMELGRAIRSYFQENSDPIDLLKEVLALHGFGGYGHEHGLVARGELYLKTEDSSIEKYKHSCDAEIMERVDTKLINFLKSLE